MRTCELNTGEIETRPLHAHQVPDAGAPFQDTKPGTAHQEAGPRYAALGPSTGPAHQDTEPTQEPGAGQAADTESTAACAEDQDAESAATNAEGDSPAGNQQEPGSGSEGLERSFIRGLQPSRSGEYPSPHSKARSFPNINLRSNY